MRKESCKQHTFDYFKLKILIGGALYPDYFSFEKDVLQEKSFENQLMSMTENCNPNTTVFVQGFPRENPYIYAKSLITHMEKCGNISRLYFKDGFAFVEFDRRCDLVDLYSVGSRLRSNDYDLLKKVKWSIIDRLSKKKI